MALNDYMTYNDVRAALGVSVEELEDATIGLELYESAVDEDVLSVHSGLPGIYVGIMETVEADRTPQEQRLYKLTRLFATYSAARVVGQSLPMFGPKSISDGKATMSRFADSPYKDLLDRLDEQYASTRDRLLNVLDEFLSASTPEIFLPVFSAVSSDYDPITGT